MKAVLNRVLIRYRSESPVYPATSDELRAVDEAEQSGIASEDDVEAAFSSFRRS